MGTSLCHLPVASSHHKSSSDSGEAGCGGAGSDAATAQAAHGSARVQGARSPCYTSRCTKTVPGCARQRVLPMQRSPVAPEPPAPCLVLAGSRQHPPGAAAMAEAVGSIAC